MSGDIIQLNPEAFQSELKGLVKSSIEETLNAMLDEEAKKLVNAERYAREEERKGYRAGHYDRKLLRLSAVDQQSDESHLCNAARCRTAYIRAVHFFLS